MADVDKVRATLRMLIEACSAANDATKGFVSSTSSEASDTVPVLAILHNDFISLLTLIYTSTTKLTLSLRAEQPAYKAALRPMQDLVGYVSSMAACAMLFEAHGATLAGDVRQVVREVCQALIALTESLLDEGEEYLMNTGMVHELVDNAKRGLPADNQAAVKKRWATDRGMLEDTLQDVTSMIEDNGATDEEDGFGDDELDELGLGISKKMTVVEMERTKKIQPLIRFTTLLHKRVQLDIFSKPLSATTSSTVLDSLAVHSHAMLVASEDIVATLYSPQDPSAIAFAITPLATSVKALHPILTSILKSNSQIEGEAEKANPEGSARKDNGKWFETCFKQIDKLSRSLCQLLVQESPNDT